MMNKVKNIPENSKNELEIIQSESIKSMIIFPLLSKDKIIGILGFDTIEEERNWSEDVINLLKMICVIIVNTLESKKAEQELLETFMSRLSDREIELLKFFAQGFVWPEDKRIIGKKMDVLPGTLDKYYARIKEKMNIEENEKVAKIASMYFSPSQDE